MLYDRKGKKVLNQILELKVELDRIRPEGIQKKLSEEAILKRMISFLMEYRKSHTLSGSELEALLDRSKKLTKEMEQHISRIRSLSGA